VITVVAAAIVHALDENCIALTALSIAFVVVDAIGLVVLLRHASTVARSGTE